MKIAPFQDGMNCIVTAGPTYESLDNVRRLTNFSTGELGCELATFLSGRGHSVTLLLGEQATYQGRPTASRILSFTSTANLREQFLELASSSSLAIFHAAAVSDFTFGKIYRRGAQNKLTEVKSGKVSTRSGTLLAELVPTPKLIAELRQLFPVARIAGWKYDVEGGRASAVQAGRTQRSECLTDACVINGPAYGDGFGLLHGDDELLHAEDRSTLFASLARVMGL